MLSSGSNRVQFGEAFPAQVWHRLTAEPAVVNKGGLVPMAGLVPGLADQTGLGQLLSEKARIVAPRIKSVAANPAAN